jgi:arylsulfatase A-like enzyme
VTRLLPVSLLCGLVLSACRESVPSGFAAAPLAHPRAQLRRATLAHSSRFVLPAAPPEFPLTVAPGAQAHVAFGVSPSAWELGLEEIEFVVSFRSGDDDQVLFSKRLQRGADEAWRDADVSLLPVAGRTGALRLAAKIVRGQLAFGELLYWTPPVVGPVHGDARPNIVLVSIDTLRADHLGCYGYRRDTSPNLDRLAREGVLFRQAIASSSWTFPSHVSMLSGLNPGRHGAVSFNILAAIPAKIEMLAERLWDAGYRTAGFTGGGFVGGEMGFDRGFGSYIPDKGQISDLKDYFEGHVDDAIEWIGEVPGVPFFLFLHTYAVHMPYQPPPPYDRRYDGDYVGPCATAIDHDDSACTDAARTDPRTLEHIKALYDGEIRRMDEIFGRFIDHLRASGLADRTCVIVTSDHGEEFMEHGGFFHNHAKLYDELLRVPMIAWCPGRISGGQVVDTPVSLIDVAPTALDLAGQPLPPAIDGMSLLPALHGRALPARETTVSSVDGSVEKRQGSVTAIRSDRYKLIASTWAPAPEFYDLQTDPGETRDVASAAPIETTRFAQILDDVRSTSVKAASAGRPAGPTPDAATVERLRALGYVE